MYKEKEGSDLLDGLIVLYTCTCMLIVCVSMCSVYECMVSINTSTNILLVFYIILL